MNHGLQVESRIARYQDRIRDLESQTHRLVVELRQARETSDLQRLELADKDRQIAKLKRIANEVTPTDALLAACDFARTALEDVVRELEDEPIPWPEEETCRKAIGHLEGALQNVAKEEQK